MSDPLSELGCEQEKENPHGDTSSPAENSTLSSVAGNPEWLQFFEMQNQQMRALIEVLKPSSGTRNSSINLPEFSPDDPEADARSWCVTAELCLADHPLEGSKLVIVLSKALKKSASTWLSQIAYNGMTWLEFKQLFTARFITAQTNTGTLINLISGKPSENESLAAYASRLISLLMNQWKDVTKEQIAVSMVFAHIAHHDQRLQRLAFTTELTSRHQLQQELQAFSFKRKLDSNQTESTEMKRLKNVSANIRCYHCGRAGHRFYDCRSKGKYQQIKTKQPPSTSIITSASTSSNQLPQSRTVVCYKCGAAGHIASRCQRGGGSSSGGSSADRAGAATQPAAQRRVDLCMVDPPPAGTLIHKGQSFLCHFDSGAECSLIKEKVASKFSGKRSHNVVLLTGLGSSRVYCTEQILCEVEIDNYTIEILFHVLPDECDLRSDIQIGREIFRLGFGMYMSNTEFHLMRQKCVDTLKVVNSELDLSKIDTDVSPDKKVKIFDIMNQYSDYFISGMPTTRVTTGQLEIRLIDPNRTVQRAPYRFSEEERKVLRNRVDELLAANIIRPSFSPFASPALLVKKHDGSDRMCIDYRELNRNTVPDRYPLPLISDQITRLHGAKYFTKLDCASGFHLIPVSEQSIERTAFITPDGQYEFLTMPFGLRNAVSVFQRAIVKALRDLVHTYVVVYVDDILIMSSSVEGLERLNVVLERLTQAGFSLNLKKCSFLKTRVEFLGYEVEAGEVKPNKRKIEALSSLPPPQSVSQLRQFIGLASYFRQFVPNFASLMSPLHRLTSSKTAFNWTTTHEEIRQKVITILTSEPVLMIFDPQYPVELHTDASSEGYGGILIQVVDNKRRVVGYYSKRTSPAESRYHSYELETLAVVNSVKHFRQYLHGRKFTVITDCNSLKSAYTKVDLPPRVHRWWAFLQSFEFDVIYRPGKYMTHADFLSRNPLPAINNSTVRVEQKRVDITQLSDNWLLAEQQRDDGIQKIKTDLNDGKLTDDVAKTYEVRKGLLHRKVQRNGRTKCIPIVPRAMQWSVVNNVHESLVHLGWEKTLDKLYDYYWFEGMSRFVRKFVDNCVTCKVAKSHSGKVQAELHPIPKVPTAWHTIHIDVTGKLSGKNDTKEYAFVLIDAFTKYVLLSHTTKLDTVTSIQAVKKCVALFGAPARIIADQGRNFASKEFREFCDSKNIELHLIATGSSRANGQVERVMSVLKSMLTAVELGNDKSWQDALGEVQLALNCTKNRTTQASPLELLIGKVARPLDLMADDVETPVNISELRTEAARNIEKCAQYNKQRFDRNKAKLNKFSVGEFVLIENEERNQTKLDPKFKGPFQIIEVLDGDRYLLQALNCKRRYKYAHDRLRKMPEAQVALE
ncbi:hypothetical protein O0L34_g16737 [Tuta absoluta]|nr:hypothetical protein O0L34_g16737 [Tuta absoluta]